MPDVESSNHEWLVPDDTCRNTLCNVSDTGNADPADGFTKLRTKPPSYDCSQLDCFLKRVFEVASYISSPFLSSLSHCLNSTITLLEFHHVVLSLYTFNHERANCSISTHISFLIVR